MSASVRPEGGPAAATERAFPALDGLRLLAASAIVVTHATFWSGAYAPEGIGRALSRLEIGVPVFFVLSGFLLTRPYLVAAVRNRPRPRAAAYLWRRALRILPAYWLLIPVALLLLPTNAGARPETWLRYLTLTQVYTPGWLGDGLTQTWSLCTEVAFYLLLPVAGAGLARLVRVRPARPRGAFAALGCAALLGPLWTAWSSTVGVVTLPIGNWLPGYTDWFAAGMALALLTVADPAWAPARVARELAGSLATCWCAAAALFWIACGPLAGPTNLMGPTTPVQAVVRHLLYLAVAVLAVLPLVLGDQRRGATRRFLARPALRYLGDLSYGLFLFHSFVLIGGYAALGWAEFTGDPVLVSVGTWLGGIAVAAVVYELVERPLRRWRGLVRERPTDHSPATTGLIAAASVTSTST